MRSCGTGGAPRASNFALSCILSQIHLTMPILLEVCVDSVASAIAAKKGGAQRIELCGSMADGGITPSAGLIAMVRKNVNLQLHVLIRPRIGDFCYTAEELEVIKRDILLTRQLGANGISVGVLTAEHRIELSRTRELVDLAGPLSVTFHRAFDSAPDLLASLEDVVASGADRILTSGGAPTAEEGAATLARLVASAGKRIGILACGHIREENVAALLKATGVEEVHANLQTPIPGSRQDQRLASSYEAATRFELLPATVTSFLEVARKAGRA
jgi:copper homeostasis protein